MLSPFGHGLLCLLVVPREQGCEVYLAGGRFTCRKDEDAGGDHDRIEQNANRNQRRLQLHLKASLPRFAAAAAAGAEVSGKLW